MKQISEAEQAERLLTRRARMLPTLAVLLIAQQGAYFAGQQSQAVTRWVDYAGLAAWAVLTTVILLTLVTGGFWLRPAGVRRIVDDEMTRAARGDAVKLGFVLAMALAIALHVLAAFEPIEARPALQLVLSVGLVAALLRFGFLERRALADG